VNQRKKTGRVGANGGKCDFKRSIGKKLQLRLRKRNKKLS
jgi:hypothetical protein